MQWIASHWQAIAFVLGVWAMLASLLNKTLWPKPVAPKWAVVLHAILIDAPAFLPSVNLKGLAGLPVNVPFLSLSGEEKK